VLAKRLCRERWIFEEDTLHILRIAIVLREAIQKKARHESFPSAGFEST